MTCDILIYMIGEASMDKKGQALIEFILILPVMVYLILVFVDFALILSTKNKLDDSLNTLVSEYKETSVCPSNAKCVTSEKYEKLSIQEEYTPITPGLNLILKKPYYIKSERVVLKNE